MAFTNHLFNLQYADKNTILDSHLDGAYPGTTNFPNSKYISVTNGKVWSEFVCQNPSTVDMVYQDRANNFGNSFSTSETQFTIYYPGKDTLAYNSETGTPILKYYGSGLCGNSCQILYDESALSYLMQGSQGGFNLLMSKALFSSYPPLTSARIMCFPNKLLFTFSDGSAIYADAINIGLSNQLVIFTLLAYNTNVNDYYVLKTFGFEYPAQVISDNANLLSYTYKTVENDSYGLGTSVMTGSEFTLTAITHDTVNVVVTLIQRDLNLATINGSNNYVPLTNLGYNIYKTFCAA